MSIGVTPLYWVLCTSVIGLISATRTVTTFVSPFHKIGLAPCGRPILFKSNHFYYRSHAHYIIGDPQIARGQSSRGNGN